MKLIRILIIAILSTSLLACSFGTGNNSTTKAEIEDRERFMQEYSVVFGVYEGTISNRPKEKVELSIYPIDASDGKDERGQPRVKLVAKARLRWPTSNQGDVFLDVRYIPENADIQMTKELPTSTPEKGVPPTSGFTFVVRGKVSGDNITGVVVKSGGTLGTLDVRLKSREPTAPSEGDIEERHNRMRELYKPMVGAYSGQVKFVGPKNETMKFYMTLYIAEGEWADGTIGPTLVSYYRRFDDPRGEIALTFDCDLSTFTDPPSLTMISRPYPGPPNSYKIMINARVSGNTISGTFQENHKARTGEMTITKMKKSEGAVPPKK